MKKILVPTDFTTVADVAIKYACELGKAMKSEIHTLHIVKGEGDKTEAMDRMIVQAADVLARTGYTVHPIVKVGNIFDDIPQVAEDEKAQLIVMGTHGLQGMQFIVGSNALRVISESNVPIIIVQDGNTRAGKVDKLLVPLDLHQETKQKLNIAAEVATLFKAEAHIVSPKEKDEYLHNRLARNISYAEGFFEERNISYKTTITDSGSSGFVKDLLKYSKYAEIDLICIVNSAEEQLIHAFGIDSEQKIITNDGLIPVMVLNPTATLVDNNSIFAQ